MKKENWEIEYRGLMTPEMSEELARFWVEPTISNNGVYSGDGGFEMAVSIICAGIDRKIDEEGLNDDEIEKIKEMILMEL
jgi:hypothetical protein